MKKQTREEIEQEYALRVQVNHETWLEVHTRNMEWRDAALAELPVSEKCAGCFCHTHGDNSTTSEINADLLAAAEGVIADVIVTKDNGDRRCIVCMAYFDADAREPQAHVTYCPILTLTAAIKKAKGQ